MIPITGTSVPTNQSQPKSRYRRLRPAQMQSAEMASRVSRAAIADPTPIARYGYRMPKPDGKNIIPTYFTYETNEFEIRDSKGRDASDSIAPDALCAKTVTIHEAIDNAMSGIFSMKSRLRSVKSF